MEAEIDHDTITPANDKVRAGNRSIMALWLHTDYGSSSFPI